MEATEENVLWKAARLYQDGTLGWTRRWLFTPAMAAPGGVSDQGCLLGAMYIATVGKLPSRFIGFPMVDSALPNGSRAALASVILELNECDCDWGSAAPDASMIISHYNDHHCDGSDRAVQILEKAAAKLDEVV